ncbi:MAG TPA: type II secretion system F family protein [Solirubrobacteraceae bacterium]|nr:type II secretion system F family protein [Solirubrobacteraceae bacterium]
MTGFLLGLCFGAGVALIWLGVVVGVRFSRPTTPARLDALLRQAAIGVPAVVFVVIVMAGAVSAGLLVWWIIDVPALVAAGVLGGAFLPIGWAQSRRDRLLRERERAWPAVLNQLADALESGLAFPAAVAHVTASGPVVLRGEFAAFSARLRGDDIASAVEGLRGIGERTADSVALLLRAALVDTPTGGLSPVLRELAGVLAERLQAREKARTRAANLRVEAAIVALSPIFILLLFGSTSPQFLSAYRTVGGTFVLFVGGLLIYGCYAAMRRLGRVPEPRRTRPSESGRS